MEQFLIYIGIAIIISGTFLGFIENNSENINAVIFVFLFWPIMLPFLLVLGIGAIIRRARSK